MIKVKVIGKLSNKKSCFLFHGLFATGGYFVPYIKYLTENYKVFVFDIDFAKLLLEPASEEQLKNEFNNLGIKDPDKIICHSLGSIIPILLKLNCNNIDFIAPPFFCQINKSSYLRYLSDQNSIAVSNILELAIRLSMYCQSQLKSYDYIIYIPDNDDVFNYFFEDIPNYLLFSGNHFQLSGYFENVFP